MMSVEKILFTKIRYVKANNNLITLLPLSVGGGWGQGAAAPASWAESRFTQAYFEREQQEIGATFLPAL